jgi:probable HAF family extracellular repeat protein
MWRGSSGFRWALSGIAVVTVACAGDPPLAPGAPRGAIRASVDAAAGVAITPPIDLGNLGTQPGNAGSIALGVNEAGWVVGEAHTGTNATRAFLWKPGSGMTDLGTLEPTDTYSRAYAINDAGWVVGASGSSSTLLSEAVLWRPGEPPIALGVPGGHSNALAINNSGLVVGTYEVGTLPNRLRAFAWQNGVFRDLPALGIPPSRAQGVSDAGVIVGGSRKAGTIGEEAVAWYPGETGPRDLGVTAAVGSRNSAARDMNARGDVVGFAVIQNGGIGAFIWHPGVGASLLAAPTPGLLDEATAINDAGRAVGIVQSRTPVLWDPVAGQVSLPRTAGATTGYANAISNSGYIAGYLNSSANPDTPRAVLWRLGQAPVANAGGPYTGAKKKPIAFDGTGSADPDGDALTYSWNFGDGSPAVSGATPVHEYGAWGTYTVTLTVTDPLGLSATISTTASVAPPGKLKKL